MPSQPAKRTKPPEIPKKVNRAILSRFTGYSRQGLNDLAARGIIPTPSERGIYDFEPSILGIVRELMGRKTGAARDNRDRRDKAEADRAEVDAAKAIGDCISVADAKEAFSEMILKLRLILEEAQFTGEAERKRTMDKVKAVKLEIAK